MIHVFAAATQYTLPFNIADYYQYLGPILTAIVFIAHARGYKVPVLSALLDIVLNKQPSLPVPLPPPAQAMVANEFASPAPRRGPLADGVLMRTVLDHGDRLVQAEEGIRSLRMIMDAQKLADVQRFVPPAGKPAPGDPVTSGNNV